MESDKSIKRQEFVPRGHGNVRLHTSASREMVTCRANSFERCSAPPRPGESLFFLTFRPSFSFAFAVLVHAIPPVKFHFNSGHSNAWTLVFASFFSQADESRTRTTSSPQEVETRPSTGQHFDSTIGDGLRTSPVTSTSPTPHRIKRRTVLPLILFFATCLSTWVGVTHWQPVLTLESLATAVAWTWFRSVA